MGGKSARKGANGERELAAILRDHGYDIRRGGSLSFGEVPDLSGLPGIHIEVKRRENVNLSAALEQARRDAVRFGGLPAVWRVTMNLEDWLTIYKNCHELPDIAVKGGGGNTDP